jgi:ketosteroid isomerase-like protein
MGETVEASAGAVASDWPGDFFRDADSLELDKLVAWFADDVDVRFANAPSIIGKANAEQAFKDFWSTISGMSHRRETVVFDGDDAAQGSIVTYTRPDGLVVSMPVSSHLRRNAQGKLTRLWIYIDMAPLFATDGQ